MELEGYNPDDEIEREAIVVKYCLEQSVGFTHRHRYQLVEYLEGALRDSNHNFSVYLDRGFEELSSVVLK